MRLRLAAVPALAACAVAAHGAPSETRYNGPRLSFSVPVGVQVREVADPAADYAVELVPPKGTLAQTSLRIIASQARVGDADVEIIASAWRDARLRNRASWGVRRQGETRTELAQIGSRRFVRFSDQMSSVLGAARQLMLCGSVSGRLVCGVASGPSEKEQEAEAVLVRVLETVLVHKK